MIEERGAMHDDPFIHALNIAREARCPAARYISTLESFDAEDEAVALMTKIRESTRSKYKTYVEVINPALVVHDMYSSSDIFESKRLIFTRVRLSSHNLAIEKGRWQRQPREQRLCDCGAIQDELHVSAYCPNTSSVRANYPGIDFKLPDLFNSDSLSLTQLL